MALDQKTLELFARIAALRAVGRAGAELSLSPSAATQRIQSLEAELGVQLFNRTTRRVSLTEEGERFLVHARRIVDTIEEARADLKGSTVGARGELRVTASASFGRRHIAPHMAAFFKANPNVTLRLNLSDTVVDMVDQGFDLALRIGVLRSSTLVARKLADNPRLLVAAPKYLEIRSAPRAATELLEHNCIVLGENRIWHLRAPDGKRNSIRVNGNFQTDYGEAATEAAVGGAGIALKSKWDVQDFLDNGQLVPILPNFVVEPAWSVWAVRPAGHVVPARVAAFIGFMEQRFRSLDRGE